jgi:sortase (surface protein transpeptidase)
VEAQRRTAVWLAAAAIGVTAIGGAAFAGGASPTAPERERAPSSAEQRGWAGGMQDPQAGGPVVSRAGQSAAVVAIPAIGVESTLERLALDPGTGELAPPVAWLSAGWYADGTVPGDVGPAVIAGHVDSASGPAVFARLDELSPGDEISVTLSTGEVVAFVVTGSTAAPKDAFPTDLVYGPTPTPDLRLITCDGDFNRSTGHYDDNLIVFATARS